MPHPPLSPAVIPLSRCEDPRAGGKALGLAKLHKHGLRVPDGFVLLGAKKGQLPDGWAAAYAALGGPVAVRSSSAAEDGAEASFAGQYETYLNVEGEAAVREAVEACLGSADAARARAYRGAMQKGDGDTMAVVIQRMLRPRAAGVLFTVDPVTRSSEHVVVEAIPGLGDALVSGRARADRFLLNRDGSLRSRELAGAEPCLDATALQALLRDALHAETRFGHPLDLEWAIDEAGALHFLQARPITTLDLPGHDEFDTPLPAGQVQTFTTYNISEVLPGATSPLTWSVAGQGLDRAMLELFVGYGVPRSELESMPMVATFSGRPFLNMRPMYALGRYVAGASKEGADYSVAGHVLPDVPIDPPAPGFVRLRKGIGYFRKLLRAGENFAAFARATAGQEIPRSDDPRVLYEHLGRAVEGITAGMLIHLQTSSLSGAMHAVLLNVLSSGKPATSEHHSIASALLASLAVSGAEKTSLALPQAFERLATTIAEDTATAAHFRTLPLEEALSFLQTGAPEKIRAAFRSFLADHGHRCVLEIELHQADWEEDPRPLLLSLQRVVAGPRRTEPKRGGDADAILGAMPALKRLAVTKLMQKNREGVVLRERSKSHLIRMIRKLRRAYLAFAELLVAAGTLPDKDLLFFMTHSELGRLVQAKDPALIRRALHRRRLHPQRMAIEFPNVSVGKPVPLTPDAGAATDAKGEVLHGTPVSRGVVVGRARVARTLAEADGIEPGEILVVAYTDVGWAPYFIHAAALATEIGGTLSHGAVVAREYGLPAVVNLPGITRRFRTGDLLRLDGTTGEVRKLDGAQPGK